MTETPSNPAGGPARPSSPPDPAPKIVVREFSAFFDGVPALKNISLEIHPRERLAVIGPARSGKTTFLRSLNRMNDLHPHFTHSGQILSTGKTSTATK